MDDAYDAVSAQLACMRRRQAQWGLCPYGEWTEDSGSRVIFDRSYRPICRVALDGQVEIVPSDEFICFREQRCFHQGFGINPKPEVRKLANDLIKRYGLASELRHRLLLLKKNGLPRWVG